MGLTKFLKDNRKSIWPSFPIEIGPYKLQNVEHSHKEFLILKLIWLHQQNFRKHDPKMIVISIGEGLKGIKYYIHQDNPFESLFENATSYQEIQ